MLTELLTLHWLMVLFVLIWSIIVAPDFLTIKYVGNLLKTGESKWVNESVKFLPMLKIVDKYGEKMLKGELDVTQE